MKTTALIGLFGLATSLATSTLAHHGTALNYDAAKWDVVTGTVTSFAWTNPHAQLYMDVKDASGKVLHYAVELNSPGVLYKGGWTRHEFKAGDVVSISVHSSLVGAPLGECPTVEACKVSINGQPAPTSDNDNAPPAK